MDTVIHIKTDKKLKKEAAKLASDLGFSLGTLINATLRNFVATREIHFTEAAIPTPYLERVIAEVEQDLAHRKNISGPFTTSKAMDDYLDKL